MKIYPAPADPDAVPHGLKDVQVRATRWGWVVQKRPRKGSKKPTQLQRQYETRFGFAARMAANPVSLDLRTATEISKGSDQVPRDLLTQAALGRLFVIENPDGTVWRQAQHPVIADGLTFRDPSLIVAPVSFPEDAVYLTDEDGNRITLSEPA